MLYIDIGQWEHTVRGAQYDKAIWCWRKLSISTYMYVYRIRNDDIHLRAAIDRVHTHVALRSAEVCTIHVHGTKCEVKHYVVDLKCVCMHTCT